MVNTKALLSLTLISGLILSAPLFAQKNGFYAGGQLGYSDTNNTPDLPNSSKPPISMVNGKPVGFNAYADESSDENGLGGRLYAGYQFNKYLALESGYTHYADTNVDNAFGLKGYNYDLHSYSVDTMAKGMLPITDHFHLYAKGGAAVLEQDKIDYHYVSNTVNGVTVNSLSDEPSTGKDGSFQPAYALGAEYAFTDHLAADIAWNKVGFSDNQPSIATVGFSYHF